MQTKIISQSKGKMKSFLSVSLSVAMSAGLAVNPSLAFAAAQNPSVAMTTTPIQHVVIIFGENISFDHYFGTYPKAANPPDNRALWRGRHALRERLIPGLLTNNPNLNPANGEGAANPFRLNRDQALTADQNHGDTAEQESFDNGLMDLFPSKTGNSGDTPVLYPASCEYQGHGDGLLRWQYGHRALELRTTLRHER